MLPACVTTLCSPTVPPLMRTLMMFTHEFFKVSVMCVYVYLYTYLHTYCKGIRKWPVDPRDSNSGHLLQSCACCVCQHMMLPVIWCVYVYLYTYIHIYIYIYFYASKSVSLHNSNSINEQSESDIPIWPHTHSFMVENTHIHTHTHVPWISETVSQEL
jgi:hypothetical protein